MSVEPSPPETTSAPWAAAPRPNASASGTEEARMSCTVTRDFAPVRHANAAPIRSAASSSSSSGTSPRMSYALKIFAYWATPACLPAPDRAAPDRAAPDRAASRRTASRRTASHRAEQRRAAPRTSCLAAPRPVILPRRADTEPTGRPGRPAPTRPAGCWRFPAAQASGRREEPGRLADPALVLRRRAEHPEVTAPADLDALPDGLCRGARQGRLPDSVGQRLQVIGFLLGRPGREPDHIPAAGNSQPVGVRCAQVVAVRLHVAGQRAEHGGGVAVHVGQRVERDLFARGPRAAP